MAKKGRITAIYQSQILGNTLYVVNSYIFLVPDEIEENNEVDYNSDTVHVILCQKHSFLYQLIQNITTDCSLNFEFSICCAHQVALNVKNQLDVHNMYSAHNSTNNLL